MLIKNNSGGALAVRDIKLDGTLLNIAKDATLNINENLLVANAAAVLVGLFGADVSITEVGQVVSTGKIVDLVDTAVTLTAADMVAGVLYKTTPTTARAQTTPTAALLVAAIPNCVVNSTFEFTIVATAAFNETLTPGVGVTIVGSAVCNNASATYKAIVTAIDTPAITIFRK